MFVLERINMHASWCLWALLDLHYLFNYTESTEMKILILI